MGQSAFNFDFLKIGISQIRIFQKLWPNPEIVQGGSGGAILARFHFKNRAIPQVHFFVDPQLMAHCERPCTLIKLLNA